MANVKYSDLLPEVLPSLAADPSDPVTERAIKRATIQLCNDAKVWRYFPEPIDVVAGESTYDLETLADTTISSIWSIEHNVVPLDNQTIDWLNRELPGWRTKRDTPKYFTQVDTEQVILAPVPSASIREGLTLILALQPSQKSTGFPEWIYSKYLYGIAQGALAYLMLMPDKAWSNPQLGVAHMAKFEAAIAGARADAVAALGRAKTRSVPQH